MIALWVHDELVCCCRPEIAKEVGEIMVRQAKEPAEFYGFKVPLDAEYKIGRSWAGEPLEGDAQDNIEPVVSADDVENSEPGVPDRNSKPVANNSRAGGSGAAAELIWSTPTILEAPPGSTEFAAILALLSEEDHAVVQPAERPRGNGHDRKGAHHNQHNDGRSANRDAYPHGESNNGHQISFYIYRHADGQPYLGVKKTSTKQFPQYHWAGSGWAPNRPKGPKIPYRLSELVKVPLDAWVLICAGEKDADTASALGFAATTNPEGERKGAWAPELNAWFAGRKRVAIMEDNDATGRAHAIEVADALRGVVPDIRIVTFRDLPEQGDLTDWTERGFGRDDLAGEDRSNEALSSKAATLTDPAMGR